MFQDRAKIYVEGGAGGNGVVSFRREAHVPRGGPDGGDGGRGGDVVLVAGRSRRDLASMRIARHYRADRGGHGSGSNKQGARGGDLVVEVPPGTTIEGLDGERYDLIAEGQRAIVAAGGLGGHGNKRFTSATQQAPRFAEKGLGGASGWIELHLKLLADAGLVGLPNAGKSSLLARLTRAAPKVASYPFTTVEPVLGTIDRDERQLVLADIPGLIEGAADGAGLGHEFLAHVERCRLLVHLLEVGPEADPQAAYETVRAELSAHGQGLDRLPELVALSKVDLLEEDERERLADEWRERLPGALGVLAISSASSIGLDQLVVAIFAEAGRERGEEQLEDAAAGRRRLRHRAPRLPAGRDGRLRGRRPWRGRLRGDRQGGRDAGPTPRSRQPRGVALPRAAPARDGRDQGAAQRGLRGRRRGSGRRARLRPASRRLRANPGAADAPPRLRPLMTLVVKLGSSIVAGDDGGLRGDVLDQVCAQVAALHAGGEEVVMVTSGAIARGIRLMELGARPAAIDELQAASAVGQGSLFRAYEERLAGHGVRSAQVLLTAFDMSERMHYLNARQTLQRLLAWHVVPVINENDTTATDEITFGDNDFLSAQVAIMIEARRLVLLTNREGLFSADPGVDPEARLIDEVRDFAELDELEIGMHTSKFGSGGMRSKVVAAEMASGAGIPVTICDGIVAGNLGRAAAGEKLGHALRSAQLAGAELQALAAARGSRPGTDRGRRRRRPRAARVGLLAAAGRRDRGRRRVRGGRSGRGRPTTARSSARGSPSTRRR